MQFERGYLYHIFNQGNNQQIIFFNRDNYLFFLQKITTHILPYADVLAWCLMPNHFHLMVLIREDHINIRSQNSKQILKEQTLNESIGVMLRSYTRAINKQQKRSGSLFKEHTKAECLNCHKGVTPSFITADGATKFNVELPSQQYPQVCFNYIHQNPVKAKLVQKVTDWEFSSAKEYADMRNGKLVNKKVASEYVKY